MPGTPTLERKVVALDAAIVTKHRAEPGSFEGYASRFGNVDRQGDIVHRGAFAACLPEFRKTGAVLWGHGLDTLPIATVTTADERADGLWLAAEYHATRQAQDVRRIVQERLQRGKTMGLSIGYRVDDAALADDGIRHLKRLKLWEVSLVLIPANAAATVASAKSDRPGISGHHERRRVWIASMIALTKTAYLLGVPAPTWGDTARPSRDDATLAEAEALLERSAQLVRRSRR